METSPYPLSVNTPLYPAGGRFAFVASHVLGLEGGHADHPNDRGGETQFGISLRFLKAEGAIDLNHDRYADFDLDFDGDIDGADVRALTRQQALNLYYHCFWARLKLDRLPKYIDAAVFDQAVNGGAVAAVKLLQKTVNRLNIRPVAVDGVLGPQTINAVMALVDNACADDIIWRYRQEAENRYNDIVRADYSQVVFIRGWAARARQLGSV
jgi:lysozyme family protein